MWVSIVEFSIDADRLDDVIDLFRNTAVGRFDSEAHRGFRLLVDRANLRALEVSYWDTSGASARHAAGSGVGQGAVLGTLVVRTNHYELAIDAG